MQTSILLRRETALHVPILLERLDELLACRVILLKVALHGPTPRLKNARRLDVRVLLRRHVLHFSSSDGADDAAAVAARRSLPVEHVFELRQCDLHLLQLCFHARKCRVDLLGVGRAALHPEVHVQHALLLDVVVLRLHVSLEPLPMVRQVHLVHRDLRLPGNLALNVADELFRRDSGGKGLAIQHIHKGLLLLAILLLEHQRVLLLVFLFLADRVGDVNMIHVVVVVYVLLENAALLHVRVLRLDEVIPDLAPYGDHLPNLRAADAAAFTSHCAAAALRYHAHPECEGTYAIAQTLAVALGPLRRFDERTMLT